MVQPPLTIEQYAAALAHVAYYQVEGFEAVLDQLRVDEGDYRTAQDHWIEALRAEIEDDDGPLATRLGEAFEETKGELEQTEPALDERPPLVEPPAVGEAFNPVDVTSAAGVPALSGEALPFKPSERAAPPRPIEITTEGTKADVGRTHALEALDLPDFALPFSEAPELTLTQYASLEAELTHRPDDQGQILARYGVSNAAQRVVLDERYNRYFAAHPAERAKHDHLVANYISWLKREDPNV